MEEIVTKKKKKKGKEKKEAQVFGEMGAVGGHLIHQANMTKAMFKRHTDE